MPWVDGQIWQEVMLSRKPLTKDESLALAQGLVRVLATMEQASLAHCDLSGPNVLLPGLQNKQPSDVALVDVEDIYGPGLQKPAKLPSGSAGYGHKSGANGFWSADADRFSGVILIAEMLGWFDSRVRNIAFGEQYFDPQELQEDNDRFQVLLSVLQENYAGAADLFVRAWYSEKLTDTPSMAQQFSI